MAEKKKVWYCKIGFANDAELSEGADKPMRQAIAKAYRDLTGWEPEFIFSGWGGELTPNEADIVLGKGASQQFIGDEHMCPRRSESPIAAGMFAGPDRWHPDHTCSYCGSLNPDLFMRRLEAGDVFLDPTDKTYKVYVHNKGGEAFQQYYRDCPREYPPHGPDECAHWVTRKAPQAKFYFQHLSPDQKIAFVDLLNKGKLNFAGPSGYFHTRPFFIAANAKPVESNG